MRPIDADAIPKEFLEYEFDGKWNGCTIKDLIDEQPTIQQEKEQLSKQCTTSDLISRQAAIDAVEKNACNTQRIIDAVNNLPPAQPVATDTNVGDTISRQAAIDVLSLGKEMLSRVLDDIDVVGTVREKYSWGLGLIESYINDINELPSAQPGPHWIPVSERLPSKEERKEWIDNNLDGIGYLYPCLVTRYSSINPDRTKNNPYVAKHYFDGEDFLNAGEEVCSEYIIAWMPLPEAYKGDEK